MTSFFVIVVPRMFSQKLPPTSSLKSKPQEKIKEQVKERNDRFQENKQIGTKGCFQVSGEYEIETEV